MTDHPQVRVSPIFPVTDLPRALELLRDRPLASELVGRVVPLDRVVTDAFEPLAAGTLPGKVLVVK